MNSAREPGQEAGALCTVRVCTLPSLCLHGCYPICYNYPRGEWGAVGERKTIRLLLVCNVALVSLLIIAFAGHMTCRRGITERLMAVEQRLADSVLVSQWDSGAIRNDLSRVEDLLLRLDEITVMVAEVRGADLEARTIDVVQRDDSGGSAAEVRRTMPLAFGCRFFVAGQFGLVPVPLGDLPKVTQGGESPMTLVIVDGRVVQIRQ